ncbi:MAG: hypothetical protein ACLFS7_03775 [Desulfosudaceae bacterium]
MAKRHETIGIKQPVRRQWLQQAANSLLAGMDSAAIRKELHGFIADQNRNGGKSRLSDGNRAFTVNNLMRIWVTPDAELAAFRDDALNYLRNHSDMAIAVHWAMISAAYPFWFNVAFQTGRLLNLQNRITRPQIINRLKEQYGDRETITRYARYVIRSFVSWGALKDTKTKGRYEKPTPMTVSDNELAILLLESALHASSSGKAPLNVLMNSPAFFPFQLPAVSGDFIAQNSKRIEVDRYSLDDEMLKLKVE